MTQLSAQSPIIFIGMHRSGTSLLTRALEELGLFVGHKKERNNEAIYFLKLNRWILSRCGARWDIPHPIQYLWQDADLLKWMTAHIHQRMQGISSIEYLGLGKYLRTQGIQGMRNAWGWKDPQNTLTLPFWLDLFPHARIIHIERHGVDVADSLAKRGKQSGERLRRRYQKLQPFLPLNKVKVGYIDSPKCKSLEGSFQLWTEYMEFSESATKHLPDSKILKIQFEQLVKNPVIELERCADFCELQTHSSRLRQVTQAFKPDKVYAYQTKPTLVHFANAHSHSLNQWGYSID